MSMFYLSARSGFEPHDVLDLRCRDLEDDRVLQRLDAMDGTRSDAKGRAGPTTSSPGSFFPGSPISSSARPECTSHDSSFSR